MKPVVFLLAVTFLFGGCRFSFNTKKGNGNIVNIEKNFSDFSRLEVSGDFLVLLYPSENQRVVIEADDNLQPYISVDQDANRLKVGNQKNVRLKPTKPIQIHVYANQLNKVELSGACNLETRGQISSPDRLDITMAGSSKGMLDLNAPDIKISMAGSGKVNARGKTRNLKVNIAGSGAFTGPDLLSESADISISGSGDAKVFASVGLKVSIAGSGNVIYGGNPTNVKKSIAGSGNIRPAE